MVLRVVHWGTGSTGVHGLRAIIQHPDLELVGVHVHSPGKVGRDAGELCGLPPVGLTATDDLAATLALHADCLSYMANGVGREPDAIADVVPFLERGTNVVTCSLIPFGRWPQSGHHWSKKRCFSVRSCSSCSSGSRPCRMQPRAPSEPHWGWWQLASA